MNWYILLGEKLIYNEHNFIIYLFMDIHMFLLFHLGVAPTNFNCLYLGIQICDLFSEAIVKEKLTVFIWAPINHFVLIY